MLKLNHTYLIQPFKLNKEGCSSHVYIHTIKNISDAYNLKRKLASGEWVLVLEQESTESLSEIKFEIKDFRYKELYLDTTRLNLGNIIIDL